MNPMIGYAISGVIVSATNIIIESAIDAGIDVTVDYMTEKLDKIFPDIANPESFWGKFATNVKMNASAQMQARIMSQAMQVQNTAGDYVDGLRQQRIDRYNQEVNDIDSVPRRGFADMFVSGNLLKDVTFFTLNENVQSELMRDKVDNVRKTKKKEDLDRDLKRYDDEIKTFRETRNSGHTEAKTFSDSFADYNESANSQLTSNVRNSTTIDKLLIGMGYYKDKEGVYQLGSGS